MAVEVATLKTASPDEDSLMEHYSWGPLNYKYCLTSFQKLPGGGGYSREFWVGVCREGSWTLTLFKD